MLQEDACSSSASQPSRAHHDANPVPFSLGSLCCLFTPHTLLGTLTSTLQHAPSPKQPWGCSVLLFCCLEEGTPAPGLHRGKAMGRRTPLAWALASLPHPGALGSIQGTGWAPTELKARPDLGSIHLGTGRVLAAGAQLWAGASAAGDRPVLGPAVLLRQGNNLLQCPASWHAC